jgi:hypothetical protein
MARRADGGRSMRRPTSLRKPWLSLLAISLSGGVLLGACGGDDHRASADDSTDETGESRQSGSTQPEATDAEAVQPYVEDLLETYDEVVNEIIADPGVAADRDSLLVQEYLSLFEPDNEFAEQVIDRWVADGEQGLSIQPYDEEHPANVTTIDGEIEVVSSDEVRVPLCIEQRQNTYRDDQLVQGLPLLERPGESVVVRVDGEWLMRSREVFGDRSECGGEGS